MCRNFSNGEVCQTGVREKCFNCAFPFFFFYFHKLQVVSIEKRCVSCAVSLSLFFFFLFSSEEDGVECSENSVIATLIFFFLFPPPRFLFHDRSDS